MALKFIEFCAPRGGSARGGGAATAAGAERAHGGGIGAALRAAQAEGTGGAGTVAGPAMRRLKNHRALDKAGGDRGEAA